MTNAQTTHQKRTRNTRLAQHLALNDFLREHRPMRTGGRNFGTRSHPGGAR